MDLLSMCFAPVLMLGSALTIQTPTHKTSDVDGMVYEVMTCEKGLGVGAKGSTAGLFGVDLQYGIPIFENTPITLTFIPKAGLSYTTQPRPELPMTGQFELGAQMMFGYKDFRFGAEYWHLSNAGLQQPNTGLDMIVIQTGWSF